MSALASLGPLLARLFPAGPPTRRQFLRWSAAVALTGCARPRQATAPQASQDLQVPPDVAPRARVLTPAEWAPLEAATARILPSDDGPGAREAQVMEFLDRQLSTPLLGPVAPLLRLGAQLLDRWADHQHGAQYAALTEPHQDDILRELSRGEVPVKSFPQKEFFLLLHGLTLEGFLADPLHGGNAGEVGWRYIDFPTPHLRRPGQGGHHPLPVVR